MTVIYFVRHAQPNYDNHNDALRELTPKGMEDRRLVTNYLKDKSIHVVLSSPYKRAVDTVSHFADAFGYTVQTVDDFRERRVDSVWIDDFDIFSKRQWSDFNYKHTDGESLAEVQTRNIRALTAVLKTHKNKNIVIATHGTALSTIINYYDPTFGHADFERIKPLMPWIVKFTFDDMKFAGYEDDFVFEH